ncbi:MAG: hypothetical protein WBI07_13380 [Mobilitalea sp.]
MARKKELSKQDRIIKEEKRLRKIYEDIKEENKSIIDGLIQRAAYMRIALEEYEKDLDTKGYVEMFTQSANTPPYERERPVARLYSTMNKNYQTIIKLLCDLLPKEHTNSNKDKTDEFDEFVNERDD